MRSVLRPTCENEWVWAFLKGNGFGKHQIEVCPTVDAVAKRALERLGF